VFSIPAKLYRIFRGWLVLPILIVTSLCVIPISKLQFEAGFTLLLPDDDEYQKDVSWAQETFGSNDLITIAFDVDRLFTRSDLDRVGRLTETLQGLEGTGYVISLTTMEDLYLEDDQLDQLPLYRPETDFDLSDFTDRVLSTPLFRDIFISADGKAIFSYVVPEDGVAPVEYAELLIDALGEDDLHLFGDSVIQASVSDAVSRELVVLGSLALAVVFVVQVIITKSLLAGLVLALGSAVPSIWTLALLPLIGRAVETTTMMVPVIVLVLATSYGIHIFRYHSFGEGDMENTLLHVSKVVMAAGLTTLVGFVSLLLTPSTILQRLGVLIVFGIGASLVSSLLLLPPILARLTIRPWGPSSEDGGRTGFGMTVVRRDPRSPVIRLVVAGLIFLPFLVAAPFIRGGYSARDAFRSGSVVDNMVRYFEQRSEANQQMETVLSTAEQYGLVSLSAYEEIRGIERQMEDDGTARRVTSYGDFVEWMIGRLSGRVAPIAPTSEAELGEAMELLSGEGIGQIFDALVDVNWQHTRMLLQVSFPRIGSSRSAERAEEMIEQMRTTALSVPSVSRAVVIGEPVATLRHIRYLARSQAISIAVFLPLLAVFLMIAFRSFGWALLTLTPTIVGVIVYFGTVSLLGFLHDPIHVFMVAGLMGVSNDDVLYFVIVFRDQMRSVQFTTALENTMRRTGVAIVQTTVIIIGGLAVFFMSDFVLIVRAGGVAILSLASASAVTLFVVPSILKLSPRMLKRLVTEPPTSTEAELKQ
jgi:predicted RND superfamily exporter protein